MVLVSPTGAQHASEFRSMMSRWGRNEAAVRDGQYTSILFVRYGKESHRALVVPVWRGVSRNQKVFLDLLVTCTRGWSTAKGGGAGDTGMPAVMSTTPNVLLHLFTLAETGRCLGGMATTRHSPTRASVFLGEARLGSPRAFFMFRMDALHATKYELIG